jgi:hypothetical protein
VCEGAGVEVADGVNLTTAGSQDKGPHVGPLSWLGFDNANKTRKLKNQYNHKFGASMGKMIAVSDQLYERLAKLARPFVDKEPADVIAWLADLQQGKSEQFSAKAAPSIADVSERAPRERGAIVDLDGTTVRADSVPDLCSKVMEYLHAQGHWSKVAGLAPYKTSAQRYLFSKIPKHPNGNDFFVPVKCREMYVEAHKNYKTSIEQLARLTAKCGVRFSYKGT